MAFTIEDHLRGLGVGVPRAAGGRRVRSRSVTRAADRPLAHYDVRGVPVSLLMTRHNDEARPDRAEAAQYLALFDRLLDQFPPDQLIACNGHPMIFEAMARARGRGITTAFAVRGFGYYEPRHFADVDHAFTCSRYPDRRLSRRDRPRQHADRAADRLVHRRRASRLARLRHLRSPGAAQGPVAVRAARRHARLAPSRHPDPRRPIRPERRCAQHDSRHRLQQATRRSWPRRAVPTPADYFALTRILLVPSVWNEPFGRVAAEAMINSIPPLVSDRGSLPDVVGGDFATGGGGRVVPVPGWLTPTAPGSRASTTSNRGSTRCARSGTMRRFTTRWHRARMRSREERYSEAVSRRKHLDYFTSLTPRSDPIARSISHS